MIMTWILIGKQNMYQYYLLQVTCILKTVVKKIGCLLSLKMVFIVLGYTRRVPVEQEIINVYDVFEI